MIGLDFRLVPSRVYAVWFAFDRRWPCRRCRSRCSLSSDPPDVFLAKLKNILNLLLRGAAACHHLPLTVPLDPDVRHESGIREGLAIQGSLPPEARVNNGHVSKNAGIESRILEFNLVEAILESVKP